ncbi:MAG: hypothetical protein JSS81_15490 [Acidobacteria bacterium]|nr:hypothetical protein [Acidobacteriota bacterium]
MTREQIEYLWRDPRNWTYGIYSCPADPRVVVPKKLRGTGWTMNFAHPRAIPVMIGLLVLLFGPPLIVLIGAIIGGGVVGRAYGIKEGAGIGFLIGLVLGGLTFIATIVAVCLISHRMASRTS